MRFTNEISLCGSAGVSHACKCDWSCVQVLYMHVSWNEDDVKHLGWSQRQNAAFKSSYLIHIIFHWSETTGDTRMSGNPVWTPDGRRLL